MASRELDIHTGKPRTRTEVSVDWVVWHIAELAGVSVPALLAVTVNGWFATVSATVAAGWAAHEARTRWEQQRIRDQRTPAAISNSEPAEQDGQDGQDERDPAVEDGGRDDEGVSA